MKKSNLIFCLFFFLFLQAPIFSNEKMSEPYASIKDLPFDPQGWFANANQLSECFKEKKDITTVIEIGSWLGASTRHLASLIEGEGKVYAVDTWKGSTNEPEHQQDPRLPFLYQLFLSNVKHAKLTEKIVPIRMDSLEAAKALHVKADLIYLDARHDTNSVTKDILAWYPHLKEDGIFCGDDWGFPSVQIGVVNAANKLKKSISNNGNLWRLH